jgi:gamma-glutamyltranspeptidase/glutathione hydrolase
MSIARLVEDAIYYADRGFPVTRGQAELTAAKLDELRNVPGFAEGFLQAGRLPQIGENFRQQRLADTLRAIGTQGEESFYRGPLAHGIVADLKRAGSPLTSEDLASHIASFVSPLSVNLSCATAFNMPPPTQGIASLIILGLYENLSVSKPDGFAYVHSLVEATKQAFMVRDRVVTDPAFSRGDPREFLTPTALSRLAAKIDGHRAVPWRAGQPPSDTVWMGAIDARGLAVSYIQSTYWEFGSGVVLADSGFIWQNRGSSFNLDATALNVLTPGRKPFHTLNPAYAHFKDGRRMVYGTMGGDGQPQTQAAIFTRYAKFNQDLQHAVSAPRWLLGRTWGAESVSLKLEEGFDPEIATELTAAGHVVELASRFDSIFGHAGAVASHPNGLLEGASDPRSDGSAAGW